MACTSGSRYAHQLPNWTPLSTPSHPPTNAPKTHHPAGYGAGEVPLPGPDDLPIIANLKTDFGAVGDGVTDDTAAFLAALNTAEKVKGNIAPRPYLLGSPSPAPGASPAAVGLGAAKEAAVLPSRSNSGAGSKANAASSSSRPQVVAEYGSSAMVSYAPWKGDPMYTLLLDPADLATARAVGLAADAAPGSAVYNAGPLANPEGRKGGQSDDDDDDGHGGGGGGVAGGSAFALYHAAANEEPLQGGAGRRLTQEGEEGLQAAQEAAAPPVDEEPLAGSAAGARQLLQGTLPDMQNGVLYIPEGVYV